jgi:hypothetical protein
VYSMLIKKANWFCTAGYEKSVHLRTKKMRCRLSDYMETDWNQVHNLLLVDRSISWTGTWVRPQVLGYGMSINRLSGHGGSTKQFDGLAGGVHCKIESKVWFGYPTCSCSGLAQPLLMSGLLFYSAFSIQRFRFSPILAFIFIPGNNPSTKTAAGP